jgi:hypothetical protein
MNCAEKWEKMNQDPLAYFEPILGEKKFVK